MILSDESLALHSVPVSVLSLTAVLIDAGVLISSRFCIRLSCLPCHFLQTDIPFCSSSMLYIVYYGTYSALVVLTIFEHNQLI
jgi:hypothetical protein